MIYDEKSYDTHMGEDLIGECLVKLDHFIDQFTNKETKFFRETVQISDKFALKFDLFVEKTRFML